MDKTLKTIGKGNKYSIPKAALIFYYEESGLKCEETFDYGCLLWIHRIVDIAECNHCGPDTPRQVTARLMGSPFWESEFVRGFYRGMKGHGGASQLKPSERGKKYYEEFLKNRTK